ncbi:hypothetical protein E2C01_021436 [Portunus trituberculatus]|uniref:Uncharacterized protein n=1 Tax=Portunus trituberculatus TaxID=210409 RepID=A0A5B7E396_PORTR|nr:hypothetical protein [Portunus trituberculatus]
MSSVVSETERSNYSKPRGGSGDRLCTGMATSPLPAGLNEQNLKVKKPQQKWSNFSLEFPRSWVYHAITQPTCPSQDPKPTQRFHLQALLTNLIPVEPSPPLHTHPSQHVASSSVSPQPTSNSHLII